MIPMRPVNDDYDGDYVWAELGPSLKEEPTNPNEHCFSLVVNADLYEHIDGVANKAVRTLRRIAETHNNDSITWMDLYDMVCGALDEIVNSGWE